MRRRMLDFCYRSVLVITGFVSRLAAISASHAELQSINQNQFDKSKQRKPKSEAHFDGVDRKYDSKVLFSKRSNKPVNTDQYNRKM